MDKRELERFKSEQLTKRLIFIVGMMAAVSLALVRSEYTSAAFAFVGGLLGGITLDKKP